MLDRIEGGQEGTHPAILPAMAGKVAAATGVPSGSYTRIVKAQFIRLKALQLGSNNASVEEANNRSGGAFTPSCMKNGLVVSPVRWYTDFQTIGP